MFLFSFCQVSNTIGGDIIDTMDITSKSIMNVGSRSDKVIKLNSQFLHLNVIYCPYITK